MSVYMGDGEADLVTTVDGGGSIESADQMTATYRKHLIDLLLIQADSALAGSYAYAPFLINAPTRDGKVAVANLVRDEMRHAQMAYRLIEDLGVDVDDHIRSHDYTHRVDSPAALATPRPGSDRRVNMLYHPIRTWDEFLMASFLFEQMGAVTVREASSSSYGPWARAARAMVRDERLHVAQAQSRVLGRVGDPLHVDDMQLALDEWFPLALSSFGSPNSPRADAWRRYGLRRRTNEELRREFHDAVVLAANTWGLRIPAWTPPWEGRDSITADRIAQEYENSGV